MGKIDDESSSRRPLNPNLKQMARRAAAAARTGLILASLSPSGPAWCPPRRNSGRGVGLPAPSSPLSPLPAADRGAAAPDGDGDDAAPSHRRRLLARLLPLAGAVPPPLLLPTPASAAKCRPSRALVDARARLDLAVQASQSWDDAVEIANDPLLDESSIVGAFGAGCEGKSRDEVRETVVVSVGKMRDLLEKKDKTTEDAITFMNIGTGARTAVDAYFSELEEGG